MNWPAWREAKQILQRTARPRSANVTANPPQGPWPAALASSPGPPNLVRRLKPEANAPPRARQHLRPIRLVLPDFGLLLQVLLHLGEALGAPKTHAFVILRGVGRHLGENNALATPP